MRAILLALALFALPLTASALPEPVTPPAGNLVGEAEVRRVIDAFLVQKGAPLNAQVSVKKIGYSGDLKLPAGRVSFEVVAPERWEGYGNASLALIVRVDDQVKKNLTVLVEVEALAEMVVAARTLERVPIVKSGQIVTILVENEVVRITASGRAKGSGALGDLITVQNLSSQKDLAARVVDATTVRVDF